MTQSIKTHSNTLEGTSSTKLNDSCKPKMQWKT